jgi:hypothetical protein
VKAYVASKSSTYRFALEAENIIEVCATGPNPEFDAASYAKDYVKGTDLPAYVYEVDIKHLGGYKVQKEVVAFGASE